MVEKGPVVDSSGRLPNETSLTFVSYARVDAEFARKLAGDLESAGISVWLDELITHGEPWDLAVQSALDRCAQLLVILSPSAVKSRHVLDELAYALDKAKRVIPVIHVECDVPLLLARIQRLDLRERYEHGLERLVATLRAHTPELANRPDPRSGATSVSQPVPIHAIYEDQHAASFQIGRTHDIGEAGDERRMFPLRAARFDKDMLSMLGLAMTAPWAAPIPEDVPDPEENAGISAGYTYLGQFIYNDLTAGGAAESHTDVDRTPANPARLDLSSIYGLGPRAQPFLYMADRRRMLLGDALSGAPLDPNARMVPRNRPHPSDPARALIADPRNDDNVILSQLHAAFLRFHNRLIDLFPDLDFEEAQRLTRFHYQWVVLYDFLPRIVDQGTLISILPHLEKGTDVQRDPPQLRYCKPQTYAYVPVEFTAAAYRFGHSMVRPIYRINTQVERMPIISSTGENLLGFRAYPQNWAIDWRLFFDMAGGAPKLGLERVQYSYKIDTSLVNVFGTLPSVAAAPPSLAERNLFRGWQMKLPSGQAVATMMGVSPIPDEELAVGKATESDKPNHVPLESISPAFRHNAPLWYYILAEAQRGFETDETPIRLGPVGGRIVAEVLVKVMLADESSFLRQDPLFTPVPALCSGPQTFTMADLLGQSMKA
jgi:hypothetical protein